jgi:deoxycytidylate deaminase
MTCANLTTRATIIAPDGRRFVGTNYVNNPQATCPREGMPTGVGYELCRSICDQPAHAEVNACLTAGDAARGGVLYLEGHYYACDNCKRIAAAHGVEIVIGAPPPASAMSGCAQDRETGLGPKGASAVPEGETPQ